MAIPTDSPKEHAGAGRHEDPASDANTEETVAPVKSDITGGDSASPPEPVCKEEVQALLGIGAISGNEEPDTAPGRDDNGSDPDSFQNRLDIRSTPAIIARPETAVAEHPATRGEFDNILETLQASLSNTQNISSKIDALSNETEDLKKKVGSISLNCELLTAEMETIASGASTKGAPSKTFLFVSSSALALLVIFQIYMFISLINTQRLQNAAGSSVLENISGLNKKMADYNSNLTKALENQAQQQHPQQSPAVAEKTGLEAHGNKEVASANITSTLEKLNRLRNGLQEKKLIRKESGDWFVYNKKIEESISDVEVIESLNQAYKKIGRSLSPAVPLPSHNALCILKPDGKGGTEVVMTKDFMP